MCDSPYFLLRKIKLNRTHSNVQVEKNTNKFKAGHFCFLNSPKMATFISIISASLFLVFVKTKTNFEINMQQMLLIGLSWNNTYTDVSV